MSLLSCIGGDSPLGVRQDAGEDVRGALRNELYKRLDSETIAVLVRTDPVRAEREISAVLEMLLKTPAYSYVGAEDARGYAQDVLDMILGLGPIEGLLADPDVTEIMVNAPEAVFYEKGGCLFRSDVCFTGDEQIRMVMDRIVAPLGRRVDEQSPMVSARLPEGHRVNAVIPPLAVDGPVLTIRKFRESIYTLGELVSMGSMSAPIALMLSWAVKARKNIAVSGGTGGGKTTLLNALSCEIGESERVITVEDSAELRFSGHAHVVRLETRAKNAEGAGEVTIRDLVTNALRMRPDRIVVGECRGAEALDMLQAMNTGHDGSMTTLHANSPSEVVMRLVMMARFGIDLPADVIEAQIASALDIIVQQDRFADGSRRVTSVVECGRQGQHGGVELSDIATWDRASMRYAFEAAPSWLDSLPLAGVATQEEVAAWKQAVGL